MSVSVNDGRRATVPEFVKCRLLCNVKLSHFGEGETHPVAMKLERFAKSNDAVVRWFVRLGNPSRLSTPPRRILESNMQAR